jgi:thiamine-monophosphate kinase
MEIAKLGEFGLIDHLTKDIKPQNMSTKCGVGDDCTVLDYPNTKVLVTTDMLMEGIHFDLTYISMQHLGYKAAMVNISDIFAMNGTPRQLLVSIALSKRFQVEDLEDFYQGLRAACTKRGVDIVGGDTTSSYTGILQVTWTDTSCTKSQNRQSWQFRPSAESQGHCWPRTYQQDGRTCLERVF